MTFLRTYVINKKAVHVRENTKIQVTSVNVVENLV